jgi:hypothetical protein
MYLNHSLAILSTNVTVVVVPSPAASLVLFAASFTNSAQMFSNFPSSSISFATETPSFVTLGHQKLDSIITFLPFGHIVTFTASATSFIQV